MKNILSFVLFAILIISCKKDDKKISHDNTVEIELKKDSTKIEIADLPIIIDSTDYLIHPIGHITEYGSRFSKLSSYESGRSYTSYSISHYNKFSLKGEFSNLKFQHKDSDTLNPLTNEIIEITSVTFLEDIRKFSGNTFLVYTIRDEDTNKNMKIDDNDVRTLYISTIDGKNLKRLTPKLDQIVDWKTIPNLNRLYFKSIADTNKNGEFDKMDKVNYQYVNLSDPELKVIKYNPID
jgi:hypothetical protein